MLASPMCAINSLQWGRSFSERRTSRLRAIGGATGRGFNGAALFQSGEPALPMGWDVKQMLQWGRSFSERRTLSHVLAVTTLPCFNGAALFQSGELQYFGNFWPRLTSLQWGRSFSERRTLFFRHLSPLPHVASMGPLFFRAENDYPREPPTRCRRFNGAALFQSGERGSRWRPPQCPNPLQWGRSFSERRTWGSTGATVADTGELQWGRSFSERRTPPIAAVVIEV